MRRLSRYSWIALSCALPLPAIGVAVGLTMAVDSINSTVEEIRREDPNRHVCGLIGLMVFPSMGVGALAGIVGGAFVAYGITRWTHPEQFTPFNFLGTREETREKILAEIPIGTSLDLACEILSERGIQCSLLTDARTNEPFLWCKYTDKSDWSPKRRWLIRLDCIEGRVSDVDCRLAGD